MFTLGEILAIAEGEHLETCDDPDRCDILEALRHFRKHCEPEILPDEHGGVGYLVWPKEDDPLDIDYGPPYAESEVELLGGMFQPDKNNTH